MKTKKTRRRGGTKDERRGIDIPLRRRRQYAVPSPPFGGSSMAIASSVGQPDSTALRAVSSVCSVVGKVACRGGAVTFPAHAVQRYNTLDFAQQSRVPTGASRPYWKPCAKGLDRPSGHPAIFSDTAHHSPSANDVPFLENAKQARHPSYPPDGCRICFGALRRGIW